MYAQYSCINTQKISHAMLCLLIFYPNSLMFMNVISEMHPCNICMYTYVCVCVNSPHEGQWRGALMFSLIYAWINGWVNNREAGDLRRHRAHYDVTVMMLRPGSQRDELSVAVMKYRYCYCCYCCCAATAATDDNNNDNNNNYDEDGDNEPTYDFPDIASRQVHDDVIKWKHFPRYWPFVLWIPCTNGQ